MTAAQGDMAASPLNDAAHALREALPVMFRAAVDAAGSGYYEAPNEALRIVLLVGRHVEGVAMLAEEGVEMLPPAAALARTAFEGSVRAEWLLHPVDEWERERRWLRLLWEREQFHRRLADRWRSRLPWEAAQEGRAAESLERRRLMIIERLPSEVAPPENHVPRFERMCEELGLSHQYALYVEASQYAHSSNVATDLYRPQQVLSPEFGDFVPSRLWYVPLMISLQSLERPVARLIEIHGGDVAAYQEQLPRERLTVAAERLFDRGS